MYKITERKGKQLQVKLRYFEKKKYINCLTSSDLCTEL